MNLYTFQASGVRFGNDYPLPSTLRGRAGAGDGRSMAASLIPMDAVKDLAAGLDKARHIEDAIDVLFDITWRLGFPRLVYGSIDTRHLAPDTWAAAPLIVRGCPDGWDTHWDQHRSSDPYALEAFRNGMRCDWSEVDAEPGRLNRQQRECIAYIADKGLNPGLTIPIRSDRHFTFVSVLGTPRHCDWQEAVDENEALLSLIVNYFDNVVVRRFNGPPREPHPLSEREVQCLTWSARGKTIEDIATILDLSPETVRVYLKRVYVKLDAVNKPHAIAKAVVFGMIDDVR